MQSIMDATFDLLHETAQAPTLAQVARQAGMSRTAIYQYFKSPQELLQAAAREVYPRWIARVREAVDSARSREVVELLAQRAREMGIATVMVTHDREMLDLCDTVYGMNDGALSSQ